MHPVALSLLLHQALESRTDRLLRLVADSGWWEAPETLHQARVASRRLRATLRLVDPELYPGLKRHQKRLERLTEILGGLRELDVHKGILEDLGPSLPGPHGWAALEHVLELLEAQIGASRRELPKLLEDLELHKLAALREPLEIPYTFAPMEPLQMAWSSLLPRIEAMSVLVPEQIHQEDPGSLHQVRVHAKKLRYALEILAPLFPGDAEGSLKEIKALQAVLGDHHDFSVLEVQLQTLQEGLEARNRLVLSEGLQALLYQVSLERSTQYDRFREIGAYFAPPTFRSVLQNRLGIPEDARS